MTTSTDSTTGREGPSADDRAGRSRGELFVDVLLVVGIGYYLWVAHRYPPDGREIPMVVGIVALLAAVVQLIGWFLPGMWDFTHGGTADEARRHAVAADPTSTDTVAAPADKARTAGDAETDDTGGSRSRGLDVPVAMAWGAGFVAAILVLGYLVAIPLFFLAYFAGQRSWKLAIGSAVIMGLVTELLFETALGIPLPGGLLF